MNMHGLVKERKTDHVFTHEVAVFFLGYCPFSTEDGFVVRLRRGKPGVRANFRYKSK
jgi:hypothetical protein